MMARFLFIFRPSLLLPSPSPSFQFLSRDVSVAFLLVVPVASCFSTIFSAQVAVKEIEERERERREWVLIRAAAGWNGFPCHFHFFFFFFFWSASISCCVSCSRMARVISLGEPAAIALWPNRLLCPRPLFLAISLPPPLCSRLFLVASCVGFVVPLTNHSLAL